MLGFRYGRKNNNNQEEKENDTTRTYRQNPRAFGYAKKHWVQCEQRF
jgi:hypothetical protein